MSSDHSLDPGAYYDDLHTAYVENNDERVRSICIDLLEHCYLTGYADVLINQDIVFTERQLEWWQFDVVDYTVEYAKNFGSLPVLAIDCRAEYYTVAMARLPDDAPPTGPQGPSIGRSNKVRVVGEMQIVLGEATFMPEARITVRIAGESVEPNDDTDTDDSGAPE